MKYSRIAAVCVLASTFAGIAHADDDAGFYLGGGVGQAREKSGPFEGDDTSYRVFGGYSFNRYFSAEAGYIDGGTTSDDIGAYRVTIESAGLYATGIAKLPIGKYFAPFGKFGYVFHHTTQHTANIRHRKRFGFHLRRRPRIQARREFPAARRVRQGESAGLGV